MRFAVTVPRRQLIGTQGLSLLNRQPFSVTATFAPQLQLLLRFFLHLNPRRISMSSCVQPAASTGLQTSAFAVLDGPFLPWPGAQGEIKQMFQLIRCLPSFLSSVFRLFSHGKSRGVLVLTPYLVQPPLPLPSLPWGRLGLLLHWNPVLLDLQSCCLPL